MDQWKAFEQSSAAIFGEKRCPANTGGRYDFPHQSDKYAVYGQCKNVRTMSINELTALATEMAQFVDGHAAKLGVVCVKTRRGRGKGTEPIIAMTFGQFRKLIEQPNILEAIRKRRLGQPVETVGI